MTRLSSALESLLDAVRERNGLRESIESATIADAEAALAARLSASEVEWVVNDLAELGVKIGNQFFWLYKGRSLVYEGPNDDEEPPKPLLWRHVLKREFGECCHPINYANPTLIGTVDINDGEDWQIVPGTEPTNE